MKARIKISRLAAASVTMVLIALVAGSPPASADTYVPISGAGSTWSQVAVDAWRADVRASGVVVNFAGTGSTDGRSQFIQGTVDFANTEIPFQNPPEPGQQAEIPSRDYAYLPIVAGGTSFMYNLTVGGQRVRDLRLSPKTLADIFTGKITRWSDDEITHDNGQLLPDIPIVPVVRSDGAGASAQFTKYMASQAPDIYCPFIRSELHLGGSDCPSVSFYPAFPGSKAQVGSNGVANYVSASYGTGSIGYVEYAYAKRVDFPVASLLNKAGYFSQPTAGNVAVALTQAGINDDLTQNLEGVYNNPDRRTYPMSSYSYMVVPTSTDPPFNADKGKTLSTFINYFLCAGQQKADILGYSPLPKNLVVAGFNQVKRIPGAVKSPSIDDCDNPALDILQSAPQPDECMKLGNTCDGLDDGDGSGNGDGGGGGGNGDGNGNGNGNGTGNGNGNGSGNGTGDGSGNGDGSGTGNGDGSGNGNPSGAPGGGIDPLTGQPQGSSNNAGATSTASGVPIQLAAASSGQQTALSFVIVLMLCLAVLTPPFILLRRSRRR